MTSLKSTPADVQAPLAPPIHEPASADHIASGRFAVLERLLSMAQAYRNEGSLRQAMEMYWELVEDYSGTPQADKARDVLLNLATSYERNGARHEARSIYERLYADGADS